MKNERADHVWDRFSCGCDIPWLAPSPSCENRSPVGVDAGVCGTEVDARTSNCFERNDKEFIDFELLVDLNVYCCLVVRVFGADLRSETRGRARAAGAN